MGKLGSLSKLAIEARRFKTDPKNRDKRSMNVDEAIAFLGEKDPLVSVYTRKGKRRTSPVDKNKELTAAEVLNMSLNGIINANADNRPNAKPDARKVATLLKAALGFPEGRQSEKFTFAADGVDIAAASTENNPF